MVFNPYYILTTNYSQVLHTIHKGKVAWVYIVSCRNRLFECNNRCCLKCDHRTRGSHWMLCRTDFGMYTMVFNCYYILTTKYSQVLHTTHKGKVAWVYIVSCRNRLFECHNRCCHKCDQRTCGSHWKLARNDFGMYTMVFNCYYILTTNYSQVLHTTHKGKVAWVYIVSCRNRLFECNNRCCHKCDYRTHGSHWMLARNWLWYVYYGF